MGLDSFLSVVSSLRSDRFRFLGEVELGLSLALVSSFCSDRIRFRSFGSEVWLSWVLSEVFESPFLEQSLRTWWRFKASCLEKYFSQVGHLYCRKGLWVF